MRPHYLPTLIVLVAALALALGCQPDVINGWPQGHALLQGTVLRRGGVPFDGELFATCDGAGTVFRTSTPGQYRAELSWSFHAGIPADSISCEVRAGQPSFSATRRVLFVPVDAPARAHTLDVLEP